MKIAIAGYGIEGEQSYRYWSRLGDDVTILDEKLVPAIDLPEGAKAILGPNALSDLSAYDMVVRTASLSPKKIIGAKKIWSATNEFFAQCPAPIIGVTGTKGKGTTSSLIASILRAAGKTVHLLGNIGVPALEVLPDIKSSDIVVYEMSSFQLWDLEKSPHVAVVLMIEPDHLDVHSSFEEYVTAKSQIAAHQTEADLVVYHPMNPYSARIASTGSQRKLRYNHPGEGVYADANNFMLNGQTICSVASMRIPGQHNIENACAAITAALEFTDDSSAIERGLNEFTGLPHRLKFIREVDGVKYYDDNYSSAPGAVIAAIRSFAEPEIVIMGGYDKKAPLDPIGEAVAGQKNIKRIILMGQTRNALAKIMDDNGLENLYDVVDDDILEPIIKRAKSYAIAGDVVIMSPGCASFDMFKNFADRGDQYIAIVERL